MNDCQAATTAASTLAYLMAGILALGWGILVYVWAHDEW